MPFKSVITFVFTSGYASKQLQHFNNKQHLRNSKKGTLNILYNKHLINTLPRYHKKNYIDIKDFISNN